MKINFFKYQGTGNDFVIVDNRLNNLSFSSNQINEICDRKYGVGGDGFILLNNHNKFDFEMKYFNSNGEISSMCGNGARCLVHIAYTLKIIKSSTEFLAADGPHKAKIKNESSIIISMNDIHQISTNEKYSLINSGSPHHIIEKTNIKSIHVNEVGSKIRYSKKYHPSGVNVNFIKKNSSKEFEIRTYERGVEKETLSCGTGAVASAIAMHSLGRTSKNKIRILTAGGRLYISFKFEGHYSEIFLEGPVKKVYIGQINL